MSDSQSGMFLLPPPPDVCQECAVGHEPEIPHNAQTLYYGVWFMLHHGRSPTWEDAWAHCDEAMQDLWRLAMQERGVDVTSTKLTP